MRGYRLGVDVGGTFTDLVLSDPSTGDVTVAKVPSTPADQAAGVLDGLDRLGVEASDLDRFAHGTTVATNAVLERRLARTVLVTTEGFRDVLEIGRQNRPKLYDLFADRPPPVIPRSMVVEAPERVAADGSILRALAAPAAVAEAVAALGAEAVAVCLLFSFLRPEHERAVAEALAAAVGPIPISLSTEVLPVFREYERASTTAINAAVAPEMARYLDSLAGRLRAVGLRRPVEVMRSAGGTSDAATAARLPVHTLLSGPAAGAWGAASVGAAAGFGEVIAFDMGGTSTDVTLIEGGAPRRTAEGSIGGLPFAVATTDIHTVGAGGGSVAWRDQGGALRVGPRSAGADPGPACYGRGGREPTVTDAYLLLGLLDPVEPLGGVLALDPEPAHAAVGELAASLGLDTHRCAEGIVRVADAHIVRALRVVSVERGKDPRDRALLAFGGAGPLHQGPVSRALGCRTVIVPRHPGVLSALGLLAAPVAQDLARTRLRDLTEASRDDLDGGWRELEAEAERLLSAQGVTPERSVRTLDCRYRGQAFELEIPAPAADPATLVATFHAAHRDRYGYDQPDHPVEAVTLRLRAEGPPAGFTSPAVPHGRGADRAGRGTRTVVLDGSPTEVPLFDRDVLGAGDRFDGPAVVTGPDATCLILAGQAARVDAYGNLIVTEA